MLRLLFTHFWKNLQNKWGKISSQLWKKQITIFCIYVYINDCITVYVCCVLCCANSPRADLAFHRKIFTIGNSLHWSQAHCACVYVCIYIIYIYNLYIYAVCYWKHTITSHRALRQAQISGIKLFEITTRSYCKARLMPLNFLSLSLNNLHNGKYNDWQCQSWRCMRKK